MLRLSLILNYLDYVITLICLSLHHFHELNLLTLNPYLKLMLTPALLYVIYRLRREVLLIPIVSFLIGIVNNVLVIILSKPLILIGH